MYNKAQEKIINDLTLSNATSFKKISAKNFSKEFLIKCIDLNANIVLSNFPYKLIDLTEDISLAIIKKNKYLIEDIPQEHISYSMACDVVECDGNLLDAIPFSLMDKELCLKAVNSKGFVLRNVPEKLRDKEMCLTAIKNNEMAMDYIPFDLRNDDFYLEAYTVNKNIFTQLSHIENHKFPI